MTLLEKDEIQKFQQLKEEVEEANKKEQEMVAELNQVKKNASELLKETGYTSLKDLPKIKEELETLATTIREDMKNAEEYIQYISKKEEEKEQILIG